MSDRISVPAQSPSLCAFTPGVDRKSKTRYTTFPSQFCDNSLLWIISGRALRIILFMPAAMPFPFVHLKLPITGAVDQCVLHLGAILAHNLVEAGIIYGRKDVRK